MEHLAALLLGVGQGGVYAALALALVLTYRSSGVVNFATGSIALYTAYTYAGLRDGELIVPIPGLPGSIDLGGEDLGVLVAMLGALACAAVFGALCHLLIFHPLRDAPPLAKAVASIGLLVIVQGVMVIRQGVSPVSVSDIFVSDRWEIGELIIISDRIYLAATIIAVALVLTAVYRYTRFGLLTRAAAESETGAYVSGISPDRLALLNWMISAAVAGLAGILIAPLSPLTPTTYTLFVIPALAAAVVGSFQYLLPTVVAGLVIGMAQAEAVSLTARYDWMPATGGWELVPLAVILVALLVTGRSVPVRGGLVRQALGRAPRPKTIWPPAAVGTVIGLVALVATDGIWRAAVITTFISAIIGLSFVVVTGYAGQISVAQLALAGVGAFTLSGLTVSWGVPFPVAPVLAALVATVIGVVCGLPALRLRGLTLGVVTLALALAIEAVWFRNTDIVSTSGARVEDPTLFGIDLGIGSGEAFPRISFGLVCLATLVVVAIGVAKLRTSALGSAMLAVRANERSASGMGVDVVRVKLAAFAIASFIAGLGGSLLGYRRGVLTFDSFTAIAGLVLLSTAYLAGITSVWGGINAGILSASGIVFVATDRWIDLGEWFAVISGIGVVLTVIFNPEGLAAPAHHAAERVMARIRPSPRVDVTEAPEGEPMRLGTADAGTVVLSTDGLGVRYGGVIALSGLSLEVPAGSVVGLIGPNGAGKTTAIDAITGFAAATGSVSLGGDRALDDVAPHRRVHEGLGRTFQSLELYDDLTVEENVSVAAVSLHIGERADAVDRALALVGIDHLRARTAGELSQGERQLVSIARAVAARPEVLLLDEPAAGLGPSETQWLGERIRRIADAGAGVLLVDHDVGLVMAVCDQVYVLDFGKTIAAGPPDEIRRDPAVAAAYLGDLHDATGAPSTPATVEDREVRT